MSAAPRRPGPGEPVTDAGPAAELVEQLIEIVSSAKSMPLSSSALISRDEVLDLLDELRSTLPDELHRARQLLRERDEVLAGAEAEGEEILAEARLQAERMVQRTEIARQAESHRAHLMHDAEAEARRMRYEAEEFVDQKLAAFEIVLDRTMNLVRTGRERLAAVPPKDGDPEPAGAPAELSLGDDFFDQDHR